MSDSTEAHVDAAVAHVKAYVSPTTGKTVLLLAAGRVYGGQAPPAAAYPHVVLRKTNAGADPEYNNLREVFDLEATCIHQSRQKLSDCEAIADLIEQALLSWRESSPEIGLTFGQTSVRDTDPPDDELLPKDRDLVTVRVVVRCASWPRRLTAAMT
jgi:hypothetical protein